MGYSRADSLSLLLAFKPRTFSGFVNAGSTCWPSCGLSCNRGSGCFCRLFLLLCLRRLRLVISSSGNHCPSYAGRFVGQCYRGDIRVPPRRNARHPSAQSIRLRLGRSEHCSGAVYEQTAQIHIAALANAEQALLSSRAVLFGCEPKRSSHLPTVGKLTGIADRCQQSRRGDRSDATQLLQPYGYRVLPGKLFNFPVEFFNSLIKRSQVLP